jgi:hypothetical protein
MADKRRDAGDGEAAEQLALFASAPHPVVERLRGVDVDNLTPLAALQLLAELRRDAES